MAAVKHLRPTLIAALVALLLVVTGGAFYLYDKQRQSDIAQARASLDRGIALFQEKKYREALTLLQGIPDGKISDWRLPYYVATSQVMLKDYSTAAPILEKALALNPRETRILFELGVVYFKLGKLSLSKAYFGSVVEIDPDNKDAKGLMDIMAELERKQTGDTQIDPPKDDTTAVDDQ